MLANSVKKKTNMHFGLYHSLFEWFNPLFLKDKANNWTTNEFVVVRKYNIYVEAKISILVTRFYFVIKLLHMHIHFVNS